MKFGVKILISLSLVAIMIIANTGIILAADPQPTGIVKPDLGPKVEGLIPGVNGYKVFGPNAIATQTIQSNTFNNNISTMVVKPMSTTRTGYSDVWAQRINQVDYAIGSHNSESPLVEDSIWVDGAIKRSGYDWANSSSNHTSGMFANCGTQMVNPTFLQTFIAHSWHYFHKSGYVDWSPETEDSALI